MSLRIQSTDTGNKCRRDSVAGSHAFNWCKRDRDERGVPKKTCTVIKKPLKSRKHPDVSIRPAAFH